MASGVNLGYLFAKQFWAHIFGAPGSSDREGKE